MELWLQVLLGAIAIIAPWFAAYYGAQRGTAVAIAVAEVKIAAINEEIKSLRESRHEHANMLTRHEMELELMMRRHGVER